MNATSQSAFSYSRIWDDTLAMLRANAGLLTAIAGVFLFLPGVLLAHFAPPPEGGTTPQEMFELFIAWWQAMAPWMLLSSLVNMIGLIAIYLLLLRTPRMTVGAAMAAALPTLPFYFLMSMVSNFAIFIGLLLLIAPGIYLLGRLALASPVLVAELPRAPLSALQRSWELSRNRGWQIALLIVLVYIVLMIINAAVGSALGVIIFLLLGNQGVGALLVALINSAIGAAGQLIATVLIAAIYRALTVKSGVAETFS